MKKGLLLLAALSVFALVGCEKYDTDIEGKKYDKKAAKKAAKEGAVDDAATSPTEVEDTSTSPAI